MPAATSCSPSRSRPSGSSSCRSSCGATSPPDMPSGSGATSPRLPRHLRVALYFAALLVIAPPLWLVHRDLLYLAPLLAALLQRLVLPWCRRSEPQEPDGADAS